MRWTLAILITAALIAGCAPICENEVSAAVRSPSGKMKAVVFNRGCGATVGFNTQVSVLSAGDRNPLPFTPTALIACEREQRNVLVRIIAEPGDPFCISPDLHCRDMIKYSSSVPQKFIARESRTGGGVHQSFGIAGN